MRIDLYNDCPDDYKIPKCLKKFTKRSKLDLVVSFLSCVFYWLPIFWWLSNHEECLKMQTFLIDHLLCTKQCAM